MLGTLGTFLQQLASALTTGTIFTAIATIAIAGHLLYWRCGRGTLLGVLETCGVVAVIGGITTLVSSLA